MLAQVIHSFECIHADQSSATIPLFISWNANSYALLLRSEMGGRAFTRGFSGTLPRAKKGKKERLVSESGE